jgi:hypothetical protein
LLKDFPSLKEQSGWFRASPVALKVNPAADCRSRFFWHWLAPIDYPDFKTESR